MYVILWNLVFLSDLKVVPKLLHRKIKFGNMKIKKGQQSFPMISMLTVYRKRKFHSISGRFNKIFYREEMLQAFTTCIFVTVSDIDKPF